MTLTHTDIEEELINPTSMFVLLEYLVRTGEHKNISCCEAATLTTEPPCSIRYIENIRLNSLVVFKTNYTQSVINTHTHIPAHPELNA